MLLTEQQANALIMEDALDASGNITGRQIRGYIFRFSGHGDFDPSGAIDGLTEERIEAHNAALDEIELQRLKDTGCAMFYLVRDADSHYHCGPWGNARMLSLYRVKKGRHNIGRTRYDVWFTLDGIPYHGVNIGDNDILRVKRTKMCA